MKSHFIQAMDSLQAEAAHKDLTLRRVFDLLGEEGHSMLILFFCLPFLQPIPIPGLSTPLGFIIILIAFFLFRRKAPWLPRKYENYKVSAAVVLKVSHVAEKIWRVASRLVQERYAFFHDLGIFRLFNLLVFVFNAILLALPLPIPFSNTMPVVSIILCAIGHMEKDGVFILLSYLWCLLVGGFFWSLAWGAMRLGALSS